MLDTQRIAGSNRFQIGECVTGRIDRMRFPLMLGIILIHSSNIPGLGDSSYAHNSGVQAALLIEKGINACVLSPLVPIFFFISGFVFLRKSQALTPSIYFEKLRRRAFTLLLPYVLWNIAAYVVRNVIKILPVTRTFCDTPTPWERLSFAEIFITPELEPLWFIRNLILIVIISPIIYRLLCGFKWIALLPLLFADFYMGYISGVFYFALGMMTGMTLRNREISGTMARLLVAVSAAWVVIAVARVLGGIYGIEYDLLSLGFMGILFHYIILTMGVVFYFATLPLIRIDHNIAASSFFIYTFHGIISPYVIKLALLFRPETFIAVISCYIVDFVLISFISITAFILLKRFMPRLTYIMTGGRC